jgi:hypothetical protein
MLTSEKAGPSLTPALPLEIWRNRVKSLRTVAQIPFRLLKIIFDHSKARFTANAKLALWAQTVNLRPFRFAKNGCQKFFTVHSRGFALWETTRLFLTSP